MALADSWGWSIDNLTTIPNAPVLLIPPARHGRQGSRARTASLSVQSDGLRAAMKVKLASDDGKALRQTAGDRRAGVRPGQGAPVQRQEHQPAVDLRQQGPGVQVAARLLDGGVPGPQHLVLPLRSHTGQQRADEHEQQQNAG
jgi:hypothetical protein